MRLLLLEESAASAEAFRSILRQRAMVTVCGSPKVMLQEYKKQPAALVLIRLGNTSFNGLNVAKRLLASDARAKIVFISQSPNYAKLAFEAGASDYLLEPFNEKRLLQMLQRSLPNQSPG